MTPSQIIVVISIVSTVALVLYMVTQAHDNRQITRETMWAIIVAVLCMAVIVLILFWLFSDPLLFAPKPTHEPARPPAAL